MFVFRCEGWHPRLEADKRKYDRERDNTPIVKIARVEVAKIEAERQAETESVEKEKREKQEELNRQAAIELEENNRQNLQECDRALALALARKLDEREISSMGKPQKCKQSSNPLLLPR